MRWKGRRQSENIEDRRGQRVSSRGMGVRSGGSSLLPLVMKLARTKVGMVIIVLGLGYMWLSGGDLNSLLGGLTGAPTAMNPTESSQPVQETAQEKEMKQFIAVALADTEDVWRNQFKQLNKTYQDPRLVLFRGATRSACGMGEAAMGPFYCPGDQQVYIDMSFFQELRDRYKAPGDFAQAYVLAHEVGHHVQTLLGISSEVHAKRRQVSEVEGNQLSVRQELQADCFAGVWAHHAHKTKAILERGDLEEALAAATAIGDDRLQKQARGYVTPDSFTHGTSAQRVKWFKIGIESGSVSRCDTFAVRDL